jgi:hypothetical protein
MSSAIKFVWNFITRILFFFGNIITNIFLTLFYFTIFALFAIPVRIAMYVRGKKTPSTFYIPHEQKRTGIDRFRLEY